MSWLGESAVAEVPISDLTDAAGGGPVTNNLTLTATQGSAAVVVKSVGKILSATQGSSASIVKGSVFSKTLSATQGSAATLVKSVGKQLAATGTCVATVAKACAVLKACTQASVATVAKGAGKILTATQGSAAFVAIGRASLITLSATAIALASLSTLFIKGAPPQAPTGGVGRAEKGLKPRRRYYVKIDDDVFEVANEADARLLIERAIEAARESAEVVAKAQSERAETVKTPAAKARVLRPRAPRISVRTQTDDAFSQWLEARVGEARSTLTRIYADALMSVQAYRAMQAQREQEDISAVMAAVDEQERSLLDLFHGLLDRLMPEQKRRKMPVDE